MSRLHLGRSMFFVGLLMAAVGGIGRAHFPGGALSRYPLLFLAGAVLSLAGAVILFASRSQAVAEYKELERKEARRQARREEAEAKRMDAGSWGDWDAFTQIRRPGRDRIELRSSTPACMAAALAIVLAAIDLAFFGALLPLVGLHAGLFGAVTAVAVFLIGRGTSFDGPAGRIVRWWGWVVKPMVVRELDRSTIEAVRVEKKLGLRSPDPTIGRTVCYPLFLSRRGGRRLLLKACLSAGEARSLGMEISELVGVPLRDASGDGQREEVELGMRQPGAQADEASDRAVGGAESYIRKHIVEIAEGQLPDARGLEWIIHRLVREHDIIYVEVEPVPARAGYPRFTFAMAPGAAGGAEVVALYCLEEDGFTMLSSSSKLAERLPKRLEAVPDP